MHQSYESPNFDLRRWSRVTLVVACVFQTVWLVQFLVLIFRPEVDLDGLISAERLLFVGGLVFTVKKDAWQVLGKPFMAAIAVLGAGAILIYNRTIWQLPLSIPLRSMYNKMAFMELCTLCMFLVALGVLRKTAKKKDHTGE